MIVAISLVILRPPSRGIQSSGIEAYASAHVSWPANPAPLQFDSVYCSSQHDLQTNLFPPWCPYARILVFYLCCAAVHSMAASDNEPCMHSCTQRKLAQHTKTTHMLWYHRKCVRAGMFDKTQTVELLSVLCRPSPSAVVPMCAGMVTEPLIDE